MAKKKLSGVRISPLFVGEDLERIDQLAAYWECSRSEVVRNLTKQGLSLQVSLDNLNPICQVIRQELRNIMDVYINRLASLTSKGTVMSATAAYLTAETIGCLVSPERQRDVQMVYDQARKKGVAYVKTKMPFDLSESDEEESE